MAKERISAFAQENSNLKRNARPPYMPAAVGKRNDTEAVPSQDLKEDINSSANEIYSKTDKIEDHPVSPEPNDIPVDKGDFHDTKAPVEDIVTAVEKEPEKKPEKRSPGRPKKNPAEKSTVYKKRNSTLSSKVEEGETLPSSLKLTPYTKALLTMLCNVTDYTCMSELADAAIHNYLTREYSEYLPLVDMYYRTMFPDAPDEKTLHAKK